MTALGLPLTLHRLDEFVRKVASHEEGDYVFSKREWDSVNAYPEAIDRVAGVIGGDYDTKLFNAKPLPDGGASISWRRPTTSADLSKTARETIEQERLRASVIVQTHIPENFYGDYGGCVCGFKAFKDKTGNPHGQHLAQLIKGEVT